MADGRYRMHSGHCSALALNGSVANDPGRVKTRSVLFVGGVSGDPGGIVRLGAANSAELAAPSRTIPPGSPLTPPTNNTDRVFTRPGSLATEPFSARAEQCPLCIR